ncbi:MAG: hypothetical protein ACREQ9_13165, partial [Candidatus Binatia bacterium]
VSPEAVPFLPVPPAEREAPWWAAIPAGLIDVARPEYVVTLDRFARPGLFATEWFARSYETLRTFALPRRVWKSEAVLVFRRVDPPSAVRAEGVDLQGAAASLLR